MMRPEPAAGPVSLMTSEDRYGLVTSTTCPEALAAFEAAVHGLGAHRPNAGVDLGRALEADPQHVAGLALKGFANLTLARAELRPVVEAALEAARGALRRRDGGTRDERVLVEALGHAAGGQFGRAAECLDAGFAERPAAFLPFKLSHALRFMIGDGPGMLAASTRMLQAWRETDPAAGFLLGCHAFALEESGAYRVAEAIGRRAVALQPEDAWGMHAVGHVHEMTGDAAAGIAWLEAGRRDWSRCNNFSFHMAWHLALLHLDRGEHDRVLALYDAEVRPEPTDDFRDVANAVSLLWRLERCGVAVGARWDELAALGRARANDTTLMFAALHRLMALVAAGERVAAREALEAIARKARGQGEQAEIARAVGLPLARAIAGTDTRAGRDLEPLLRRLPQLGGSNAQRDLFVLALADLAGRDGDAGAFARIRAARAQLKAEDTLIAAVGRQAAQAG
ncbi:tetratricopeptide repeat protein [Amaricoccus sp. B4]|uniref:tetratricopeptide repeat protein n=1 Tax=Amaricoccus sp. B4 TaxID=3368557 RepID=UPI00371F56EF